MRATLAIWIVLTCVVAHAQSGDVKEQARAHFKLGRAFYEAGAFDGALAEYRASYDLMPIPALLFNIAQAYRGKGDRPHAIEYYKRYVQAVPDGDAADEARAQLVKLTGEQKEAAAHAPATLIWRGLPPGARVELDGRSVDGPSVQVAAGEHKISARAEGHQPLERTLTLRAGESVTVELSLVALAHARVTTSRAAQISVDGRAAGAAPLELELTPGVHAVEATAPGAPPVRAELTLEAGQHRDLALQLASAEKPLARRWYVWVPVALVVVGAAVGAGVGVTVGRHAFQATRPDFGAHALVGF